jgi:D-alanyl-D-alanine carboxypeptidase/D-alanyl-D-alanine-endopeptidase (penicillin-binding protein 4)
VGSDPVAANSTAALAAEGAVDAMPSVAELESLPLEEQATYIMKISYNRGAQTYVCLLAAEAGVDDCSTGLSEVGRVWAEAGLDIEGASLVDGSGLNGNFVTAENAVALQTIMAERPDAERWKSTMPILGVDGSLATVQPDSPAAGHVFGKTGTLVDGDALNGRIRLNTKALGGVMETKGGRDLAFMIIMSQGFASEIEGVFQANDDVGAVAASIQQHY